MKGKNEFSRVVSIVLVFILLAITVFFEQAGNPFFSSEIISTAVFIFLSFLGIFLVIEFLFG